MAGHMDFRYGRGSGAVAAHGASRGGQWMRRLTSHPFLRGVAVVVAGTAAAQLITFAFAPLITRLYGPEVFGVQGVFLAAVGIVVPLANLAYGASIALPASDDEARTLFRLAVLMSLCVSGLSAIVFGLFHRQIADAIGFMAESRLLWLAPAAILLIALAQPFHQWLARKKKFAAMSRVSIAEAAIVGAGKTAAGIMAPTAAVLLASVVLAAMLKLALYWTSARGTLMRRDEPAEADSAGRVSLAEAAYRFRDFPLFRAPNDWLNSVSHSIPPLLLAAFLGPAAAGFYVLAARVVSLPGSIVAAAVGTVFLPRFAEASHRSERLRPLLLKGTGALAAVGLVPFGILVAFAPWLFRFVFGADWTEAGEYARWLSLWFYFVFIAAPAHQAFPILGLQGQFLAYEVAIVVLRTAALLTGTLVFGSAIVAIALFSAVGALVNVSQIAWCVVCCDRRLHDSIRSADDKGEFV